MASKPNNAMIKVSDSFTLIHTLFNFVRNYYTISMGKENSLGFLVMIDILFDMVFVCWNVLLIIFVEWNQEEISFAKPGDSK